MICLPKCWDRKVLFLDSRASTFFSDNSINYLLFVETLNLFLHLYKFYGNCSLSQDMVATNCEEYFQRYRRQTHVTPMSYLSFISGYKSIYTRKKEEIGILAERMNTGN